MINSMFFLTLTVFIAQVIIVAALLNLIIKTDKKVLALTHDVDKKRVKLKWRLRAILEITEGVNEVVLPNIIKKMNAKRQNVALKILKEILQSSAILLVKKRHRKTLLGLKAGYFFGKGLLKI